MKEEKEITATSKYETDSIIIEVEFSDNVVKVTGTIKDGDVFPTLDWRDKKKRAHLLDLAARQTMNLLSQQFPDENIGKRAKMMTVPCSCGYVNEVEQPCCGGQKTINCHKCGRPIVIRGQK